MHEFRDEIKVNLIDFSHRLLKDEFTACLEKWQGADNVFREVLLLNNYSTKKRDQRAIKNIHKQRQKTNRNKAEKILFRFTTQKRNSVILMKCNIIQ
jgi:hypothetical protein